jgi:hypothetical protein
MRMEPYDLSKAKVQESMRKFLSGGYWRLAEMYLRGGKSAPPGLEEWVAQMKEAWDEDRPVVAFAAWRASRSEAAPTRQGGRDEGEPEQRERPLGAWDMSLERTRWDLWSMLTHWDDESVNRVLSGIHSAPPEVAEWIEAMRRWRRAGKDPVQFEDWMENWRTADGMSNDESRMTNVEVRGDTRPRGTAPQTGSIVNGQ